MLAFSTWNCIRHGRLQEQFHWWRICRSDNEERGRRTVTGRVRPGSFRSEVNFSRWRTISSRLLSGMTARSGIKSWPAPVIKEALILFIASCHFTPVTLSVLGELETLTFCFCNLSFILLTQSSDSPPLVGAWSKYVNASSRTHH